MNGGFKTHYNNADLEKGSFYLEVVDPKERCLYKDPLQQVYFVARFHNFIDLENTKRTWTVTLKFFPPEISKFFLFYFNVTCGCWLNTDVSGDVITKRRKFCEIRNANDFGLQIRKIVKSPPSNFLFWDRWDEQNCWIQTLVKHQRIRAFLTEQMSINFCISYSRSLCYNFLIYCVYLKKHIQFP